MIRCVASIPGIFCKFKSQNSKAKNSVGSLQY
jgi:hypothetical protein